jgi:hypothetical protein
MSCGFYAAKRCNVLMAMYVSTINILTGCLHFWRLSTSAELELLLQSLSHVEQGPELESDFTRRLRVFVIQTHGSYLIILCCWVRWN